MKLSCLQLFYLKSNCERKTKFESLKFEIQISVNELEWGNSQNESCRS
jgi:hypothetical protein